MLNNPSILGTPAPRLNPRPRPRYPAQAGPSRHFLHSRPAFPFTRIVAGFTQDRDVRRRAGAKKFRPSARRRAYHRGMSQTLSWIVLADGSRGRILVQERLGEPLRRAFDEEDLSGGRELSHELGDDRPGRFSDGKSGQRHAMEPRADPHDKAERAFCRFVAALVSRAALERRFQRLILVAPPHMLGDLRKALSPHARNLVSAEFAKNWLRFDDVDIARGLGDALKSPLATGFVPSGL